MQQKHKNIAIFIPHMGCPHQCSFCNQNSIAEKTKAPTPQEVHTVCEKAYASILDRKNTEIAFFGGSFTAIDPEYMHALLDVVQPFIGKGKFKGIRISTRPDAIDTPVLDVLKNYRVTAIELGAQSLNQQVLDLNERGHSVECVEYAAEHIKRYGFSLGLQIMVGLYGDSKERLYQTVDRVIDMRPDTVRIYPTVILKNTSLETLYKSGDYIPLSLEEAVSYCSTILQRFLENNIQVIRLGLHASKGIEDDMVGGLYHPAMRELVENQIYLERTIVLLQKQLATKIILFVQKGAISKMVGQKRSNLLKLKELGYECKVKERNDLREFEVDIKEDVST